MNNTGTVVGIVLIVVLVVLLLGGAGMMGFGMMGPGMMGGYGGMGGMMGGFGAQGFGFNPWVAVLSLVFWALIIAGIAILVVWLVRNAGRAGVSIGTSDPALELLKTRYAKGEITKEQFEEMRRTLAQ
jgi:putative membrane protein